MSDGLNILLTTLINKYERESTVMSCDVVDDLNKVLLLYVREKSEAVIFNEKVIENKNEKLSLKEATEKYIIKYNKIVPYRYKNDVTWITSKL